MKDEYQDLPLGELDEAWALALAEAERRARTAGRSDIATYLALRTSNDLLRKTGRDWLHGMFNSLAAQANRAGAGIQISTEEGHRFKIGNSTMVGSRLTLANGVRTLFVEVGWPRTPSDGFIRGGGLACANVKHLGIKSADEQLRLVVDPGGLPRWKSQSDHAQHHEIHEANLRHHLAVLLNEPQKSSRRS
ncbi:MAG TPA: hypothetical protein VMS31_16095 [Pyrinomonadaceae bacterium]|nr:hypothetical protein [Pyrinomonadaceae bacterium]